MMRKSLAVAGFAVMLAGLTVMPADARQVPANERHDLQTAPGPRSGAGVAPFFDGWYRNPDGSHTLSFGFMNMNSQQVVEVPLGPHNFIEPAEFNGMQPTYFPPVRYSGFGRNRERGAFAVTIPPGYTGDVVWTITANGYTNSVPARITAGAYELSYTPQAGGSKMPVVKFSPDGPESKGREGVLAPTLRTSVARPLEITFYMEDRGERSPTRLNYTWWKHQVPQGAEVQFEPESGRTETEASAGEIAGRDQATTSVLFSQPGEYMLRVRVDNFNAGDSNFGNNCCWTNGFVRVIVTE